MRHYETNSGGGFVFSDCKLADGPARAHPRASALLFWAGTCGRAHGSGSEGVVHDDGGADFYRIAVQKRWAIAPLTYGLE